MLGLRDKLRDAPFLKDLGLDAEAYLEAPKGTQTSLDLVPTRGKPGGVS